MKMIRISVLICAFIVTFSLLPISKITIHDSSLENTTQANEVPSHKITRDIQKSSMIHQNSSLNSVHVSQSVNNLSAVTQSQSGTQPSQINIKPHTIISTITPGSAVSTISRPTNEKISDSNNISSKKAPVIHNAQITKNIVLSSEPSSTSNETIEHIIARPLREPTTIVTSSTSKQSSPQIITVPKKTPRIRNLQSSKNIVYTSAVSQSSNNDLNYDDIPEEESAAMITPTTSAVPVSSTSSQATSLPQMIPQQKLLAFLGQQLGQPAITLDEVIQFLNGSALTHDEIAQMTLMLRQPQSITIHDFETAIPLLKQLGIEVTDATLQNFQNS